MVAVIVTLIGAAIIFGFGLWSAQIARDKSKARAQQTLMAARRLAENQAINTSEEANLNKANPDAMEMAVGGGKN
jgi:hypothetical protein